MREIWILGATGRIGRAVAAGLTAQHFALVLVGRDTDRLRALAASLGKGARAVTADSMEAIVSELERSDAAVVVNTIGPFVRTAVPISSACAPGTHYVDISNELDSVVALLALDDEAKIKQQALVTASGFGVLGTEGLVMKLCEGRPAAQRVRVDALPSFESEPGRLGEALAASIIGSIAGGGRAYVNGQLKKIKPFSAPQMLRLPDGSTVQTAGGPSGDLEAARRASGATFALAASSFAPTSPLLRTLLPPAMALLRIPTLGNFAIRRLASIEVKPLSPGTKGPVRSEHTWTHARVEWADGNVREGWMRLGDAMAFTVGALIEVVSRLARNQGRPGAYTPGALFGHTLAVQLGAEFFLEHETAS